MAESTCLVNIGAPEPIPGTDRCRLTVTFEHSEGSEAARRVAEYACGAIIGALPMLSSCGDLGSIKVRLEQGPREEAGTSATEEAR